MQVTIWTSPSSRTTPSRCSSRSAGARSSGVRAHRGAQLAHHGGGVHAAAHHVADHERRAAGADLDHVVPVAADLRARDAGLVEGGDLELVGVERQRRAAGCAAARRRSGARARASRSAAAASACSASRCVGDVLQARGAGPAAVVVALELAEHAATRAVAARPAPGRAAPRGRASAARRPRRRAARAARSALEASRCARSRADSGALAQRSATEPPSTSSTAAGAG